MVDIEHVLERRALAGAVTHAHDERLRLACLELRHCALHTFANSLACPAAHTDTVCPPSGSRPKAIANLRWGLVAVIR